MRTCINLVCFLVLAFIVDLAISQTPDREITHVSGDLYSFRNQAHIAVFLVTKEGVIATDPISESAARWLEEEIRRRFSQEIRYVIYSHSDEDHIAGGQVYEDTATVVAHENAYPIIAAGNYTATPTVLFRDYMEVHLGGQQVVLRYLGKSHTDNLIVIEFPSEKAVFVVDSISVKRLPYRTLNRYFMPDAIEFMRRVEKLDFDIFVPGHGEPGVKQDVVEHRQYVEALYSAVTDAKANGLSLEQAQKTIKLESFRGLSRYDDWLSENIQGMYQLLD